MTAFAPIFAAALLLQATQPALDSWTPAAVIAVIGTLVAAVLSVWAAVKAQKADTKGDTALSNSDQNRQGLRSLDEKLTSVALATPAPAERHAEGGDISRPASGYVPPKP